MVRQLLSILIPLAAPTVLYILYAMFDQRRTLAETAGSRAWWVTVPWHWLLLSGALLAGLVLAIWGTGGGAEPGQRYVPAQSIDGEISPGRSE